MAMMKPALKGRGEAYYERIVSLRRHLHQFPEVSGEEHATSETVQEKLDEHGIPFTAGYARTGVLGVVGRGTGQDRGPEGGYRRVAHTGGERPLLRL